MRVLLAPDSFKGALSAPAVCQAMEQGIHIALPDAVVDTLPVADGGEGTVECVLRATGGQIVAVSVPDLFGEDMCASYGRLPDGTAVMEVASVLSRQVLGTREPDIFRANSAGVGHMIVHAIECGVKKIVLGLGGSATNDAGIGLLHALGVRLLDFAGRELLPIPLSGLQLAHLDLRGLHPGLADVELRVACDVTNPLCGPHGATAVFGPQKGVTSQQIPVLDEALAQFAHVVKEDLGTSILDLPGAGAAGGIGGALAGVLGAPLVSGIDLMLDLCAFDERVRGADLVITGEGQTDQQTVTGKVVLGVARRAKRHGVPVIALSGAVSADATAPLHEQGVTALFSVAHSAVTLAQAIAQTKDDLVMATQEIMRLFVAGVRHS